MRPNARRPLTAFLFLFYCETMFLHYAFSKDIVFVFGSVYVSPTLLYEHKKRKKKRLDWLRMSLSRNSSIFIFGHLLSVNASFERYI